MIRSIGLDIVEISRIERGIKRFGPRLARRILGAQECTIYERRPDKQAFLAGRLAAKEAVIKGLSPYLERRLPLRSIQILNDESGAPRLLLPAALRSLLGGACCVLSLTHEKKYAAAVAVFEEEA